MLAKLAVCAALLFVAEGEPAKPQPAPEKEKIKLIAVERNIIHDTNQQRRQYGLPPLEVDPKLVRSARRQATWMTVHRALQHTSDPVAENIAMGQRDSQEVVRDWMSSPGHRANILNRRYRRIGAAAYSTPDGAIYWCEQFMY
jgi:uncharacterized protein YkwD